MISQSFIDAAGKKHTWDVDYGPEPGWYPVTVEGRKTGFEILAPGDTGLGIQARFLGSKIGPRRDFAFESVEKALAAVLVYRTTSPSGERVGRICEPDLKTDHAVRPVWSVGTQTRSGSWTIRIGDRETMYRVAQVQDGFIAFCITDSLGSVDGVDHPTIEAALRALAEWHAAGGPAIVRE